MNTLKDNSFSTFIVVWSGQLISNIGSGLTAFALGVFIFERTHSATSYAMMILASFLPSVLLKPVGGVLADRFDRRLMMVVGDLGSILGVAFILACLASGRTDIRFLYTGAVISSVFSALQNPAYKASVSDFLSEEDYGRASGLMQLAASSQFLVSPVIAGFLFGVMDIAYILVIDIMTFLVAVLAVFFIRRGGETVRKEHEKSHFIRELAEGWHAVTSKKGIPALIGITTLICFFMGCVQTLLGPMMLTFTDAKGFGTTQSLSAVGLLGGSFLIGIRKGRTRLVGTMSLFLVLSGLFYALIGFASSVYAVLIPGFLFFFTLPFIQTSIEVLIRRNTANDMQGRVWSLVSVATQIGYPLAYGLAGVLADRVFTPLLMPGGFLAPTLGHIMGTGPGRGIGLMFLVSGMAVSVLGFTINGVRALRNLE